MTHQDNIRDASFLFFHYLCTILALALSLRKTHTKKMTRRILILLLAAVTLALPSSARRKNGRPKVGLVLGGGGAKGAATIGALKYIERSGIPIDYIAGTSIGAIIGGLYSCGYRSEELDSMFRHQDWLTLLSDRDTTLTRRMFARRDGITYVFGFPVRRSSRAGKSKAVGLMYGDRVTQMLDSMTQRTDSISFDSLPIPFRCVATDYRNRRKVVLSSGRLSQAIRASMAIPGAFKAIEIDSVKLLDGGLVDNLPVDVVRDMGADIVIAVDLTQNKHEDEDVDRRSKRHRSRKTKSNLARILHWAAQRPDLPVYRENLKHVDVYINPDLKGFSAGSFSEKKISKMIKKGEEAGAKVLKQLRRIRKRIRR